MQKISTTQKVISVIFGLFLSVVLFEIVLHIGGFVYLIRQEYENRLSLRHEGAYKILCLGDSLTAMGGEYSYPRQLEEILNQRDIGAKFTVINKGIAGASSGVIVSQLEHNLAKYKPHMVVVMMGENDGGIAELLEGVSAQSGKISLKGLRICKLINILRWHFPGLTQEIAASQVKKSLAVNQENDGKKSELGWIYWSQGKYDKAEEIFKDIILSAPKSYQAYTELGRQYWSQGRYAEAEEILKRAINIDPINNKLYRSLAICYNEQGEDKFAEEYFKKARILDSKYYNPVTLNNYLKLKEKAAEIGVLLVCVQSPLRSIDLLKQKLSVNKGVIFVDNEMVFENAIKNGRYGDYFQDMSGGDSGHCTPRGYRLIAEQIANAILKECFSGSIKNERG